MIRSLAFLLALCASQAWAATLYVRSTDGNNSDNGSTWALAKATLAGALSAAAAGDTVYVSHVHAETPGASYTVASPGTAALPCYIVCVNDGAEPPTTLATTATIRPGAGNFAMAFTGSAYAYGIEFATGTTNNSLSVSDTGGFFWRFERCILRIANTNGSQRINLGTNSSAANVQKVQLVDSQLQFGGTGQGIIGRANLEWFGGGLNTSGASPNALFILPNSGIGVVARLSGVDLSHIPSGSALASLGSTWNDLQFENCRLASGVSITSGTHSGPGGPTLRLINCDSGASNYRYHWTGYAGSINHSTAVYRTGGASDGTTSFSRQMVSSASTTLVSPLVSDPILRWNETTGSSVTVAVEVVTDNVTLTDAEAWIEVEYLNSSSYPISSIVSDRKANILSSAAHQTSSSVGWTTTGITTPLKQKLEVTFTPQMKGPIRIRVHLAKPSTTLWFCPKVTAS